MKIWRGTFKLKFVALYSTVLILFLTTSSPAFAECYAYDDLGRLISVVYDNDTTNAAKRTYNLDKHGNRTTVEDETSSGESCTVPDGVSSAGDASAATTIVETGGGNNNGGGTTNTPPVTDNEVMTLQVNATLTVNPLEGDTDVDNDALTLTSIVNSSSLFVATKTGNSVVIAASGIAGTSNITYNISDGNGGTATGTIFVTVTNVIFPPPGGGGGDDEELP